MAYVGTFNNEVFGLNLQTRRKVWTYEHPERKFPFYSTAAVHEGKIYVGGRDKIMHALDAKTGKAAWTFPTKARVDSSPVIADGRVIFGSNDGNVYFLDAASGKQTYQFTAGAAVSSSPALSGDKVIITAQDGKIYCLGS
jgi:outer membrane protein assembly factor BamB